MKWRRSLAAGLLAAALAHGMVHANADGLALQGEGTLRWFGFKIYDARLFAAKPVTEQRLFESAFALELTYARDFSGKSIAQTSIDEIKKFTPGAPGQHERWLAAMQAIFPDVKAGDQLRGMHDPGRGATFLFNGKPVGMVADPEFSRAFFSIWLDPQTVKPDLRRQLLGMAGKN
jgi:hypothetical protein